jgi:Oligosaccharyltransferase subunit Ribophorin II
VASLRGLKAVGSDLPSVRLSGDQKRTLQVSDSNTVKLEIVDSFGKLLTSAKSIKVSLADISDNKAGLKDITSSVKLSKDNSQATWTVGNLPIGRYQLLFTIDGAQVSTPVLTVADQLAFQSAQYTVATGSKAPSKWENKVEYPRQITAMKQATDDNFIHMSVQVGFTHSTSERPAQVYLSLRRKSGDERSLWVNSYGKLNKDTGLYDISLDVTKDFDVHFNGDYEMALTAADYRGLETTVWNLGTVKLWYKEGHESGSNNGVKPEYRPLPEIRFSTPAEQPQISMLVITIVLYHV